MTVLRSIVDYLKANGIENVSADSVKSKLTALESSYRDARALFGTTGEGVTEEDIQRKIVEYQGKVDRACPFWNRLHPVFCDSPKMATPYAADNTDATDDVERFLMGNGTNEEVVVAELDSPLTVCEVDDAPATVSTQAADGQATAVASDAFTSKKKPVHLLSDSSASSGDDSKSEGINPKPKKKKLKVPLTLSGSKKHPLPRKQFLSYDEASEGYEKRKLDLESEKIDIARRKVITLEKTAEYQHAERMEALSIQRLEAEARRIEAQSSNPLLQIQLENLKRQQDK